MCTFDSMTFSFYVEVEQTTPDKEGVWISHVGWCNFFFAGEGRDGGDIYMVRSLEASVIEGDTHL